MFGSKELARMKYCTFGCSANVIREFVLIGSLGSAGSSGSTSSLIARSISTPVDDSSSRTRYVSNDAVMSICAFVAVVTTRLYPSAYVSSPSLQSVVARAALTVCPTAIDGASAVEHGPKTTIVADADRLSAVAVIVALPSPTPVTSPELLTEATVALLDVHVG